MLNSKRLHSEVCKLRIKQVHPASRDGPPDNKEETLWTWGLVDEVSVFRYQTLYILFPTTAAMHKVIFRL